MLALFLAGHYAQGMSEHPFYAARVETPEGTQDYITLVPAERAFTQGLPPEAIVGVLLRPDESITPDNFARNKVFVDFLHAVIGRHGPDQPGCKAEATRLGEGWIYIIDQRTPTPAGPVPPEDILGAFEAKYGRVMPGSYRPSAKHMILSPSGFFQLEEGLWQCLLTELEQKQ